MHRNKFLVFKSETKPQNKTPIKSITLTAEEEKQFAQLNAECAVINAKLEQLSDELNQKREAIEAICYARDWDLETAFKNNTRTSTIKIECNIDKGKAELSIFAKNHAGQHDFLYSINPFLKLPLKEKVITRTENTDGFNTFLILNIQDRELLLTGLRLSTDKSECMRAGQYQQRC
jgi:hypothetical protein